MWCRGTTKMLTLNLKKQNYAQKTEICVTKSMENLSCGDKQSSWILYQRD